MEQMEMALPNLHVLLTKFFQGWSNFLPTIRVQPFACVQWIHPSTLRANMKGFIERRTNNETNLSTVRETGRLELLFCVLDGLVNVQAMKVDRSLVATLGVPDIEYILGVLDEIVVTYIPCCSP